MSRRLVYAMAAVGLAAASVTARGAPTVDWYGYAQLTAQHRDKNDNNINFGADRVRLGANLTRGAIFGGVQLDFNAGGNLGDRPPGTLPNIIQLAFAGYKFNDSAKLTLGQVKTPLGMDFNMPGSKLDITKRGLDAGLVLNRAPGVMVSGRNIVGGLGYDVGYFNIAGRSGATAVLPVQQGDDATAVGRLLYDFKSLHLEAAYGNAAHAGGPGTSAYNVFDLGARYTAGPWTFKAELIDGHGVRGESGRDELVYYAHGGYLFTPQIEGVIRVYDGRSKLNGAHTDLQNTYFGVNVFFDDHKINSRLQLNYVLASGDGHSYTGVRGFKHDAVFLQYQLSF